MLAVFHHMIDGPLRLAPLEFVVDARHDLFGLKAVPLPACHYAVPNKLVY